MAELNSLLKLPDVIAMTTLSRSTIYQMMSDKEFPRPIKLGKRAVAWRQTDITAWLESRKTRAA